jgi:hypothetical protein
MKEIFIRIACCISIILVIAVSGCVAPPKENATSARNGNFLNPNQPGMETTTTPNYVTEVTPFVTGTASGSSGFSVIPTTPTPGDLYCRIYSTTLHEFNHTAIEFNLQNPPMYINYTVKPSNITEKRAVRENMVDKVITIDTYSPVSTFVITVLNKATGEVFLQDGFGTRQYTTYLNRTLKVLKRDNLQIEFKSSNITASAMVWVKPEGNFAEPKFNTTTDCAYFTANPRNDLPFVTATPTPTWTG